MLIEAPKISVETPQKIVQEEVDKDLVRRILTFIETRSWFDESYPRLREIAEHFGLPGQVIRKRYMPEVNRLLATRGLKLFDEKTPVGELDPFFVMAVNLLTDVSDKRSKNLKLKTLDKNARWFDQQLLKKENREFFQLRVDQSFAQSSQQAKISLAKLVEQGDLPSIKYYHEFTGIHDPNKEINNNLNKLISLFMEVLAQHVTKEVIEAVSREFDTKLLELG